MAKRHTRKKRKGKLKLNPASARWLIVGLIFLICVVAIFYAFRLFQRENLAAGDPTIQNQLLSKIHGNAWIEFDFNNGKKREFEGYFDKPYPLSTVLDSAAKAGKIKISARKGKIEKVDNIKGDWRIYQNNKFAGKILYGLSIKAGDKYKILRQK